MAVLVCVWALGYAAAQIYPEQRLAPGARLGGMYMGGMNAEETIDSLEEAELAQREVEFYVDTDTVTATFAEAGVSFKPGESYERARNRQQVQRRGAGSAWNFWGLRDYELAVEVDEERFHDFLEAHFIDYERESADARVVLEGSRVRIEPEQPSWQLDTASLQSRLQTAAAELDDSVAVPMRKHAPEITAEHIEGVAEEARQILALKLILVDGEDSYQVSRQELADWLMITTDDDGWPQPALEQAAVTDFLSQLAEDVDVAPEPIERVVRDGEVTSETSGEAGYEIDIKESIKRIEAALFEGAETEVDLVTNTLEPPVERSASFSRTTQGVEALLARFADEYYGNYGLAVESLSGDIKAGYQADQSFITASTYKAFLGYVAYQEIEAGRLDPQAGTGEGSVAACMREMLVASTNPCAIAIGHKIGWPRVDELLHENGLVHTRLDNHTTGHRNKVTTPADAVKLLSRIERGQGISSAHRQQMLEYLQIHNYRNGWPAGFSGHRVANKVGFLAFNTNDIAIVYGQRDTYVVAAYSSGGSFWAYAELGRRLARTLE